MTAAACALRTEMIDNWHFNIVEIKPIFIRRTFSDNDVVSESRQCRNARQRLNHPLNISIAARIAGYFCHTYDAWKNRTFFYFFESEGLTTTSITPSVLSSISKSSTVGLALVTLISNNLMSLKILVTQPSKSRSIC